MAAYISEITYEGIDTADWIEIAVDAGTDLSGHEVYIYNSDGSVEAGPLSLGTVQSTILGKDVYLVDSGTTGFAGFGNEEAVALVDDLGNVVQFVSFESNTVTGSAGPANGDTSTSIGTAGASESLQSDSGGTSYHTQTAPNSGTIPCYAPSTLIETPDGPRRVEKLQVGDLVRTLDHGPMPIRWLRAGDQLLEGAAPDARPVLIRAGAFGPCCPARDLVVSPQHRILVGGAGQLDSLFQGQCFAPAKALTGLPRIQVMRDKRSITWHHFALDHHAVVSAEGCFSESLLLGPMVLNGLTGLQRRALAEFFGASGGSLNGPAARDCVSVGRVRRNLRAKERACARAA